MAVLNWGSPKIEFTKTTNGKPAINATWSLMPDIVEGTTILETTAGDKTEAKNEAGEVVDTRIAKSSYSLTFEVFKKKGESKPIDDVDGVIKDNYAVRVTPEDPTCEGFIFYNASVSCVESYTAADGTRWAYTFDALKPASDTGNGQMLQPYTTEETEP